MKKLYLLQCFCLIACATAMFSCQKDLSGAKESSLLSAEAKSKDLKIKRQYGKAEKMGKGEVRTYITLSENGEPLELGVEMSKDALISLPTDHLKGMFHLKLPGLAKDLTPFDHVMLHWNPHGHAPFFYEHPHFDFHFYMQDEKEIEKIPSYAVNPNGFDNNPPAGFLPPSYIAPPGGEEEKMGKHWVDATAPELPWNGGKLFTKTFIYGSYNGKLNFFEPMVTLEYLKTTVASSSPFPQPTSFDSKSFYPTIYNIYRNVKETYNVSLSGFVLR